MERPDVMNIMSDEDVIDILSSGDDKIMQILPVILQDPAIGDVSAQEDAPLDASEAVEL